MAEICSSPFTVGGSLGGDGFVLVCVGVACFCVFVGVALLFKDCSDFLCPVHSQPFVHERAHLSPFMRKITNF